MIEIMKIVRFQTLNCISTVTLEENMDLHKFATEE